MRFSERWGKLRLPEAVFALTVTAAFVLLAGWTAFHHEMWRDEIQAWLLARDSASPFELFRHMKYEGHPALWHLLLMPLTRLTWSPQIMQVFHLLIAATTVWLVTRYAPFPQPLRAMFAFGYFPFYEYAILCRNYGLGMLLLVLLCLLWERRYERFLSVGIVLFLLGHTSVHALILGIVIGGALGVEALCRHRRLRDDPDVNLRVVWIGFAVIAFGVLTSAIQLNPPPDSGFAVGWRTKWDRVYAENIVKIVTRAFLPIPNENATFWNSHWLASQFKWAAAYQGIQLKLAVGCVLLAALSVWRHPTLLLIYLGGTVGLLTFFYVKYFGAMRHHGFVFLAFFVVSWLGRVESAGDPRRAARWTRHYGTAFLALVLAAQVFGGWRAARLDREHLFTNAKAAAETLRELGMDALPIIGERDPEVSAMVGHLKARRVYYVRAERWGSFVRWDKARTSDAPDAKILAAAKRFRDDPQYPDRVVIVTDHALKKETLEGDPSLSKVVEVNEPPTVGDERYFIYLYANAAP
ncbi:MAG: hypothetical protein O3A46_10035 [Candidatus Poribacteria bacterium]|nr:hypothetical protein [Candidatus Poribacteria bacterium]